MLLVIHNLPKTMSFYDVKSLIQDKCGLNEIILDNLTLEGDYKRITVGLADEGDAALLVRKINGLYLKGSQLYVEDVRQKKLTEQPYRPIENPHVPQLRPEKKAQYNRQDAGMVSQLKTDVQPVIDAPPMISKPTVQMAYSNLPFYMSPVQTSNTNSENHAAQGAIKPQPQVAYFQTQIQQPVVKNQWTKLPAYASYPAKPKGLPDDDPISNSCDWQLEERRHSRSPSPSSPPSPAQPDNEPQRRDRKKTESSRSELDRRSPGRHRARSGKRSRREEFDGRSVRDRRESSPARRRDGGNRSSRPDEDTMISKHHSHLERSPPRDRDFDTRKREDRRHFKERERVYDRNDKRRAADYRDRERKRSDDRREKPRLGKDYDKLYERRYNKPIVEQESDRDLRNKRPSTDVSQSSRTYGNDPDSCTFSVSNASTFEKQPIAHKSDAELESFDHKVPAKRSKFDLNTDANVPPTVDPSKPTSALEPDMHKMIIRHNNWRYQVAAILARQIVSAARRPGAPKYVPRSMFKKLKECVVARIDVHLGDTIVTTLMEMIESYRSRFPPEDDVTFFNAVLEKIEREEQETAADQVKENTSEVKNNEKITTGASVFAENAAKDAHLMPPPSAPAQIRIPSGNPRPSVPPFQNRAPNVTPTFQNIAPTVTPQCHGTAPAVTPQYQNTAPIITPQFQNTTPTVTPQFQNTAPIITPQYENTASIITPQFQNTAPTVTPQYQNTASIMAPQFQDTAQIWTPLTNIAPNPNPYFQISGPTAFQNIAPHPNPYYQNLPNPNPHFKNTVPTPRFQKKKSNPQLIQLSPGGHKIKKKPPPVEYVMPLSTPQMPTPSASMANNKTLVSVAKTPMTEKDVLPTKKQRTFHKEDVFHNVEPLLKQAIEDEIAPMVELYSKRPEYFMKNTDLRIYQTISKETTARFKKVLSVHLAKRVLDIKSGLVLRIIPVNRWPNSQLFNEWTKKNGILKMTQGPDVYTVVCDSYKSYDDLAALKTFKVGDIKMEIRTLHGGGSRKAAKLEVLCKQQVPGSSDLLLFDEDAEGAGIDNTNKYIGIDNEEHEGIDNEEEDTYNADATEDDDVVIQNQEKGVMSIEDNDVTDTQDDEGTELTEGVDAGSGDQNDFIDNADNDGNNVEFLEKGNEKAAENVESLQNEQIKEEYLEKGEESLGAAEDTLKKAEETLETGEDTLIKVEETLETGEDTLIKVEETLETGEDTLIKVEETLETGEDTLIKVEETLETGEDTLIKVEETLETGEDTLIKVEETLETGEDTLIKVEETLETGEDTLIKVEETLETGEDTLIKVEETLETGEDTLIKVEETLETGEGTLEKSEDSSEIPGTEFSLSEENLGAEIIDDIAEDDLEDF